MLKSKRFHENIFKMAWKNSSNGSRECFQKNKYKPLQDNLLDPSVMKKKRFNTLTPEKGFKWTFV
jgi:hypothetical protein